MINHIKTVNFKFSKYDHKRRFAHPHVYILHENQFSKYVKYINEDGKDYALYSIEKIYSHMFCDYIFEITEYGITNYGNTDVVDCHYFSRLKKAKQFIVSNVNNKVRQINLSFLE